MDKIKRGQAELTIIDLTDDRKLVGFLSTSKARQVIYNPNTDTYNPDFSTENMTIKPELYISGSGDNVIATAKAVKWYYRENTLGNRQPITASNDTYTINSDRSLSIKKNILAGNLTYEFIADIEYVEPNSELITIIPTNVELVLVNSGEDGAVGFQGEPGADGKPTYTHIAWANSEDGTVDFSTTVSKSKAFVGMYVDNIEKNSTNPVDYNWSQIRGNDGISVTGIAEYYLATTKKENVTINDAGWTGTVQTPTKEKPYLWNYEVVNYSMGDSDKSEPALIGMYAEDGVGIETVTNKYLTTSLGTGVTVGNTGWVDKPAPTTQSLRYLWSYSVISYTNGTSENTPVALIGVHGEKGDRGIQGVKGIDGTSSYTHIAYANSSNGVDGFSKSDSTDKLYVGMYVDNTELDSDNPTDYKWSRIKGLDGAQGIPGTKGADGRTPYFHIAYADDDKGTNFDMSDPTNRKYMGTYTDFTKEDSVNYADYAWSLVKGDKGEQGPRGIKGATGPQGNQGIQGPKGIDGKPSYTHIAYADTISGANLSFTDASKPYIGIYTNSIETSSSAPTSYTWSKWLGEDGNDGIPGAKGADGRDSYTHFAYATNSTGTAGFSTTDSLNKSYLGIYTDSTKNDSVNPSDYTWTLIKGATGATGPQGIQGLQGPQGNQGIPGVKGADGKTTYTHIAYAEGTSGENFNHSTFSSATHVGMYTSTLETSSANWRDYQWTLIRGRDGSQGIQGKAGTDGRTPYFHIAYADNETGTVGFSVNDSLNKKYMGTYTDFTENDSTNAGDYTWALIKGDDGISITEVVENYLITTLKTGVTRATSGWTTTPQTATKAKPYLWNYKLVKYSSGSNSPTEPVMIGMYTEDGVGIESITNMYLTTTQSSGITMSSPGWSATPDTTTSTDGAPLYVWNYETIKYTNGTSKTSPVALIGVHGAKGIPGVKGADGRTSYTHIGYANSADGSKDFSTVISEGRSYVGMYTDFTEKNSSNPTDYNWSLIKGADGSQGIPGKAGADGRTPYFHTAWANNITGTSGFSTTVSSGKTHIGTYSDFTASDSTNAGDYKWVLIKGDTGATGSQGVPGKAGADGRTPYFHTAYTSDGPNMFSKEVWESTEKKASTSVPYITLTGLTPNTKYLVTTNIPSRSSRYDLFADTDFLVRPISSGSNGVPLDGGRPVVSSSTGTIDVGLRNFSISEGEYWIKVVNPFENFSTDNSTGRTHIGQYTDYTVNDSTNPNDYSWSLIKGSDGNSTYVAYLALDTPLTEDPSLLYSTNGVEAYPNTANLRRETFGDSNKLVLLNNSGIIRRLNPDIARVDSVSPEKLKDKEILSGKEVRSIVSDDSVSMVTVYGETKVTEIGERNTYNASNINYSNVSSASIDGRNALVTSKSNEVFYPISNPVSGVYRVTFDYKVVDSASVPPKVVFYYADGTTDEATSPSLTSTTWKTITLSSKVNGTVIGIGYSDPRDDEEDVEEPDPTPQEPIEDNEVTTVVEVVAIPYKVIEREDTNLDLGKTRVEVVGKDGKKEITTTTIGSKGTPVVTEKILENPVDEIRYIGSKSTVPVTPPVDDEVITKVTTEPIAYKTIRRNNANMYVGTENTVQSGVNGIREITTVTIGSTGTPTVTTRVIVDPIDEIIDVGTLPKTSTVNFTVVKKEEVVEPPVTNSPRVVMLGDSITMGYGRSSKIPDVVKQELSAEMVQNAGYGSTTSALHPNKPELRKIGFTKLVDSIVSGNWTEALNVDYSGITYATPTTYQQSITDLSKVNFSSVDSVVIMYGTNDWAMDVPLDNANDRYDQSTYLGALRYGINKLQQAYPHLEILVSQPILWTMGSMNSENYNNGIGLKVKDYANALNNSLTMGVPITQVYNKGITLSNYTSYFNTGDSTDGTHPNSAGNIVIGKLIASEFIRLLGDTRGDSSVVNFNITKATETEQTSTVTINFLN